MIRLTEFLGGLMFLIGFIFFVMNPRKAIESIDDVLKTPSPRIESGKMVIPPRNKTDHKATP